MIYFSTASHTSKLVNSALKSSACLLIVLCIAWAGHALAGKKPNKVIPAAVKKLGTVIPVLQQVQGLKGLNVLNSPANVAKNGAKVELWGGTTYVHALSINGNDYAAIIPDQMTLGGFLPLPLDSPFKKLTITNGMLIYVPTGTARDHVAVPSIPPAIRQGLTSHVDGIALKEGFNLLGNMSTSSSKMLTSLLKLTRVKHQKFPVSAVFSATLIDTKVALLNAAERKAALEDLDIRLQIPEKLKIRGLKGVSKLRNTSLSLTYSGTNQREVATVLANLEAVIAKKKLPFSLQMSTYLDARKFEPIIVATAEKQMRMPLYGKRVTVDNIEYSASLKRTKWTTEVVGRTTFKGSDVDIILINHNDRNVSVEITDQLDMSAILPNELNIPGLTDAVFNKIYVDAKTVRSTTTIMGQATTLVAFTHDKKPYLAVKIPNTTTMTDLIPDLSDTAMKDVSVSNLSFIYVPNATVIAVNDLPKAISASVRRVSKRARFKKGLNVIARATLSKKNSLNKILDELGVSQRSMPLIGTITPSIFRASSITGTQAYSNMIDSVNWSMPIKEVNLEGLPGVAEIVSAGLIIQGSGGAIGVGVGGQLSLDAGGESVVLDFTVAQSGGSNLVFHAQTDQKFKPNLMADISLSNVELMMHERAGANQWAWQLRGKGRLGNTAIDVQLLKPVGEAPYMLVESTKKSRVMNLSMIPSFEKTPYAKNIPIEKVTITEHGLHAKTQLNGVQSALYAFEHNSGTNVIVMPSEGKLVVADIIPGLKKTPLKNLVLSEASLVVSTKGLTDQVSALPKMVQEAVGGIFRGAIKDPFISLEPGLSLVAALDPNDSKKLAEGFKLIGLPTQRYVLTGNVAGVFDGKPSLRLTTNLQSLINSTGQRENVNANGKEKTSLIITAQSSGGGIHSEIGVTSILVKNKEHSAKALESNNGLAFTNNELVVKEYEY